MVSATNNSQNEINLSHHELEIERLSQIVRKCTVENSSNNL